MQGFAMQWSHFDRAFNIPNNNHTQEQMQFLTHRFQLSIPYRLHEIKSLAYLWAGRYVHTSG